jgi:methyl-accepting chemotaxis protein
MGLMVALVISGFALGALALYLGQRSMQQEQTQAATRLVATFEASLYNAMLQRDLPGLQRIIDTLGQAHGIDQVRLLNAKGEVRFASRSDARGSWAPELCGASPCYQMSPQTATWRAHDNGPALEVSHRLRNQAVCVQCHGTPEVNPINGVLVINFQPHASGFWEQPALPLLAVGLLGLSLFGALMAWTLRKAVTQPLRAMAEVTERIAKGDFSSEAARRARRRNWSRGPPTQHHGRQPPYASDPIAATARFSARLAQRHPRPDTGHRPRLARALGQQSLLQPYRPTTG